VFNTLGISAFAQTILNDADAAAVRTTIGAQPLDATLTALAGLTIAADSLSIGTGADAFTQVTFGANKFPAKSSAGGLVAKDITDFALSLLDDANVAAAAATLGASGGLVAQGKHQVPVTMGGCKARVTAGAAPGTEETATNDIVFTYFDFDASTKEHIQFQLPMAKQYNNGTWSIQYLWKSLSGASGGVAWGLSIVAISDGDALDAAFGTEVVVTDSWSSNTTLYITSESGAVTPAGSPAVGDLLVFNIARVVADAGDTMAGDARLIGFRLFFTSDKANDA
jgi:hypothetical protein